MHGVQHDDKVVLSNSGSFFGAFSLDGSVHELDKVSEAIGAFSGHQGSEAEHEWM